MLEHPNIITDWHKLLKIVQTKQGQGQSLVFTNGCYDILHPGHVDLLSRAKALGDVLILALNSDDSVRRLNKGPDRPLNSFEVRAFVVAHLSSVSYVTIFDQNTPYELIELIQPNILVKGGDWNIEHIVGRDIVEAKGGQVVSLPFVEGFSTTTLVEKIRRSYA